MTTQIVCVYTITDSGPLPPATLSTALAAVPLPTSFLGQLGLRLISDATVGTVRTITLGTDAATPATVTTTIEAGGRTGLATATPSGGNAGYVRPPVLKIVPAAGSVVLDPAILVPQLEEGAVTIVNGGTLYSAGTTIVASGGELAPGGSQATFAPTIAGGIITAVGVETAGGPYNSPPTLTAVDPMGTGGGAILTSSLVLGSIAVAYKGKGYATAPSVTVTAFFKSLYPTAAAQAAVVTGFFTASIQALVRSPVTASVPVVT